MMTRLLRDWSSGGTELVPVCCNCRRERVGADDWREHVPVAGERLTHGICPECLHALYPDLAPLVSSARG